VRGPGWRVVGASGWPAAGVTRAPSMVSLSRLGPQDEPPIPTASDHWQTGDAGRTRPMGGPPVVRRQFRTQSPSAHRDTGRQRAGVPVTAAAASRNAAFPGRHAAVTGGARQRDVAVDAVGHTRYADSLPGRHPELAHRVAVREGSVVPTADGRRPSHFPGPLLTRSTGAVGGSSRREATAEERTGAEPGRIRRLHSRSPQTPPHAGDTDKPITQRHRPAGAALRGSSRRSRPPTVTVHRLAATTTQSGTGLGAGANTSVQTGVARPEPGVEPSVADRQAAESTAGVSAIAFDGTARTTLAPRRLGSPAPYRLPQHNQLSVSRTDPVSVPLVSRHLHAVAFRLAWQSAPSSVDNDTATVRSPPVDSVASAPETPLLDAADEQSAASTSQVSVRQLLASAPTVVRDPAAAATSGTQTARSDPSPSLSVGPSRTSTVTVAPSTTSSGPDSVASKVVPVADAATPTLTLARAANRPARDADTRTGPDRLDESLTRSGRSRRRELSESTARQADSSSVSTDRLDAGAGLPRSGVEFDRLVDELYDELSRKFRRERDRRGL